MKNIYTYLAILLVTVLFGLSGCGELTEIDDVSKVEQDAAKYGTIRFNFPLEDKYGSGECTKRIDLSISLSADSLYRKEYLTAANLSDYAGTYAFSLLPGKYFYQAGKICTCGGDTCLWNGYPGGKLGTMWTMGWFTIDENNPLTELITFTK